MRRKFLLTTAALSVVLGAGGLAAAQDRSSGDDNTKHKQTIQQPDQTQNKPSNDNARSNSQQTTGQAPSSAQSPTAPDRMQTAPNAANQPQQNSGQNNATGSSRTGNQSGANQPSGGQSDQPSSAQTNQPAQTNRPASAQTAPSNQPPTASGSRTGQPAAAQQQQPYQDTGNQAPNRQAGNGQAQPQVRLSASLQTAEKTRLTQEIAKLTVKPITNVNFSISVGATIPSSVILHPVPQTIVEIIPQYRGYDFFVVRDEIVIVEPSSHRIVDVIERSGGSRAQTTSTTTQRKLNLSSQQKEVIRKHSQRRVTTTGSAPRSQTKIIVGEEAPEAVEIHTFPEEVYREVPAIRSYRYIEGDRSIYLVEPEGRRVIEDIE